MAVKYQDVRRNTMGKSKQSKNIYPKSFNREMKSTTTPYLRSLLKSLSTVTNSANNEYKHDIAASSVPNYLSIKALSEEKESLDDGAPTVGITDEDFNILYKHATNPKGNTLFSKPVIENIKAAHTIRNARATRKKKEKKRGGKVYATQNKRYANGGKVSGRKATYK